MKYQLLKFSNGVSSLAGNIFLPEIEKSLLPPQLRQKMQKAISQGSLKYMSGYTEQGRSVTVMKEVNFQEDPKKFVEIFLEQYGGTYRLGKQICKQI